MPRVKTVYGSFRSLEIGDKGRSLEGMFVTASGVYITLGLKNADPAEEQYVYRVESRRCAGGRGSTAVPTHIVTAAKRQFAALAAMRRTRCGANQHAAVQRIGKLERLLASRTRPKARRMRSGQVYGQLTLPFSR